MSWLKETLWDLLTGADSRASAQRAAGATRVTKATAAKRSRNSVYDRYDALVKEMKATYRVRVNRWRSSSSGCAWETIDRRTGERFRQIESPYPKGPMSCAIFLHEIGHHAIGLHRYKPRCLEEYYAWKWSLDTMRDKGFNVTPSVEKRMQESLEYAVRKALRRGMKQIPAELLPYLPPTVTRKSA